MKQENYVIGLDLGINNVGWSILNLDEHKIEKCGVRLYNKSSDAQKRRGARSVKRRLKRQRNRINDSLKLFQQIGFSEKPNIDNKLIEKRVRGLKEKIEKIDIVNITKYMMSHRGYIPFDDEEVNFVKLDGKYPCEYYYEKLINNNKYRALDETVKTKELKRELAQILDTQMQYYPELQEIKDKIIEIFSRKREFWEGPGSLKSTSPFGRFKTQEDIEKYISNKKENPTYEKYLFEDLIGKCNVIYLNEPCAPAANIHAQKFNLINDFTNITFTDISETNNCKMFNQTSNGYKLNEIGLEQIIDYCFNCSDTLKLDKMFKTLFNLKQENATGYRQNKNEKIEMSTLDTYRNILRIIKKHTKSEQIPDWISDIDLYNKIIYYINVVPSSTVLIEMLNNDKLFNNFNFTKEEDILTEIYKIVKQKYSGYHSLSEKALIKANQDMLATNFNFQQVRKKFKYDETFQKECAKHYISEKGSIKLSNKYIDNLIASPQVKKTLRQSIKVINAIIKEKKAIPYCIAIESAKEMNGKERAKEINKEQKIQEELRKKAEKIIEENGKQVTEKLIEKVMLYEEINGYCPYCNKQQINLDDVLNNKIEIEHILPLSKSANNSYNNKTLACVDCNSQNKNGKGNKTPYEWKKTSDYEDFKNRIISNKNFSDEKKANFLFEKDLDKYSIRFINRNLRDTAYATKELANQVKMLNYYLKERYDTTIKTLSTPGQITHKLRGDNNLNKNRDIGKFHHAVDACIVASIADTKIGNIIINSQNDEKFWIVEKQNRIDNRKSKDIEKYLFSVNIKDYIEYIKSIDDDSKINLSSQINQSPQGSLSDANISKYIKIDNQYKKVSQINNIYEEDNKKLESLFEGKNKKIKLMIEDNNPKLFKKLQTIFTEYKNQKGNPFKNYCFDKYSGEDFKELKDFNPRKHGIKASENPNSPVVTKLRYYESANLPYLLNNKKVNKKEKNYIGLDNTKQYCTEIYYDKDNNKFAFLPIYSVSVNLKTKKINTNNPYYKLIKSKYLGDSNVEYITTIYNGNYIEFTKKNGKILSGYYKYFDKTNNILIFKNDTTFTSNDLSITIYDVDVLGNKKERLTYKLK